MNKEETKEFFGKMQTSFPADIFFEKIKFDPIGTVVMWSEILEDVTLDCATRFLKNWSKNNTRVPAACDVFQFHKQELIDKRMKIESVQEEYIDDGRNRLLEMARERYEKGLWKPQGLNKKKEANENE